MRYLKYILRKIQAFVMKLSGNDQLVVLLNNNKSDIKSIKRLLEHDGVHKIRESLGRIESRQQYNNDSRDLQSYEFRVFSQWGEDGIIQFLIKNIKIESHVFVEFGVQDYVESNTRFLLINNNWSGLVIDGNEKDILKIKKDPIYWLRIPAKLNGHSGLS